MYKHILVPTDGSKLSLKAIRTGARLAGALGAKLTLVHVVAPYMPPLYGDPIGYAPPILDPAEYKASVERSAKRILSEGTRTAAGQAEGLALAEVMVTDEHPWEAVLNTVRRKRCDLVVMASHGRRGLAGVLLGSETSKLLTHSKIPVLVCR